MTGVAEPVGDAALEGRGVAGLQGDNVVAELQLFWLIAAALMPTFRASDAIVSPRCSRSARNALPGSPGGSACAQP